MKYAIIGFGNLGRSLASGLMKSESAKPGDIYVCDNFEQALQTAQNDFFQANASDDVNYVIENADIVFLTVKANVFQELSKNIDKSKLPGKTIVSFMAGVTFEDIYSLIGNVELVRAMPSLAIAECEGVIGYTKCPARLKEVFSKLGYAFETKPEDIEKVMAFASCGLGFAAYLIDAFATAGEKMGFSAEEAINIATLTFKNATSRGNYRDTIKAVATPGGATEQGIMHMDLSDIYETIANAVQKAYDKMTN